MNTVSTSSESSVVTLDPKVFLVSLPTKSDLGNGGRLTVNLPVGPFETEQEAKDWVSSLRVALKGLRIQNRIWWVENGVPMEDRIDLQAAQVNGSAEVTLLHRNRFKDCKDMMHLFEPGDPSEFANDLQVHMGKYVAWMTKKWLDD